MQWSCNAPIHEIHIVLIKKKKRLEINWGNGIEEKYAPAASSAVVVVYWMSIKCKFTDFVMNVVVVRWWLRNLIITEPNAFWFVQ